MKTITKILALLVTAVLGVTMGHAQCAAAYTWSQTNNNVINFTSTSTPTTPNSSYVYWSFGDNTTEWITANPSHTYNAPGIYYACVTVVDSLSQCSNTFCDTVTVYGNVLCNLTVHGTAVQPASCISCADGIASCSMTGGTAPYTYAWSNGGTTQTQNGLASGFYGICVTDANGCNSCDSVYVNYASSACSPSFVWTQPYANQVNFVSTSSNVSAQTAYYWSFGDNSYELGANTLPVHVYANPGTYYVCLTIYDTLNVCGGTWCDTVTVWGNPAPTTCNANFIVFPDSTNSQQAWGYNFSTGGPGMSYQWSWGDNTPIDVVPYPSHVYANTGSYNICLVVVDSANQCTDTMCQSLTVLRLTQEAANAPYYVNIIPQGPQGVNEYTAQTFSLYPNPAQNELKIKSDYSLAGSTYRVLDVTGRMIVSGKLTGTTIDVSAFDKGMYILQIESSKGTFSSQRFMKD